MVTVRAKTQILAATLKPQSRMCWHIQPSPTENTPLPCSYSCPSDIRTTHILFCGNTQTSENLKQLSGIWKEQFMQKSKYIYSPSCSHILEDSASHVSFEGPALFYVCPVAKYSESTACHHQAQCTSIENKLAYRIFILGWTIPRKVQ